MKKIISVVGARPNFMKVAPIHREFSKFNSKISHLICHTGQHYDENMSKVFFNDLELPEPDFYLGVGSGTHAEQTAKIMIEFEKVIIMEKPDLVIVVGDVNSTIACSLTAAKLGVKVAHVEAGLRSFDKSMPEEINRKLTDSISDYLFVSERSGLINLKNEGISDDKIFFVGNVMIDSLINYLPKIEESDILDKLEVQNNKYLLVTLHRPSNVDELANLDSIVNLLNYFSEQYDVVFPIHPRTKDRIKNNGLTNSFNKGIKIIEPIGYLNFIKLMKNSKLVITDSGGIQEETTYLGVQCATLRNNTERPITIEMGTNQLLGGDFDNTIHKINQILEREKNGSCPELWDGKSAERIVNILVKIFIKN